MARKTTRELIKAYYGGQIDGASSAGEEGMSRVPRGEKDFQKGDRCVCTKERTKRTVFANRTGKTSFHKKKGPNDRGLMMTMIGRIRGVG